MRRTALATSLLLTALATGVLATGVPAGAKGGDTTGAYGRFGFTTQGLGATRNYGEPSMAMAPDGRHLTISTPGSDSSGNGGVQYWNSADRGKSFATTFTTSANGGGDSEVDYLPDGTLLSADLEVTDSNVKVSHDFGKTWTAGSSAGTEQDRQWLAHSPDGKTAYLVYHDFAAEAEFIATSTDEGKSWTHTPADQILVNSPDQVTAPGGLIGPAKPGDSASLADQGVNTFSGPMLVAPNGKDLYVVYSISDLGSNLDPQDGVPPFGPVRGLVVAHSGDAGKTWTNKYAVVAAHQTDPNSEEQVGTLFPWGFVDQAGTVYVVYDGNHDNIGTDKFRQYYVYSNDQGAHWSAPVRLDSLPAHSTAATVYATGDAVAPGVIDVAWYESPNGTPSQDSATWTPHFAQVTGANTTTPHITSQPVSAVPNHQGGICLQGILCGIAPGSGDRSLLDFFQLKVNPVTHLAGIAYADNNRLGKDSKGKKIGEVVYAAQTRQPSLAAPSHAGRPGGRSQLTQVQGVSLHAQASSGALASTGLPVLVPLTALAALAGAGLLRRRRGRRL